MKNLLFLLIALLFFSACEKEADPPRLRILNQSDQLMEELTVSTGGGEHTYGNVPAGATTEYAEFDFLYRYAFISTIVGSDTLVVQPIDYVGEEKLTKGSYTYILGLTGDPGSLTLAFRED